MISRSAFELESIRLSLRSALFSFLTAFSFRMSEIPDDFWARKHNARRFESLKVMYSSCQGQESVLNSISSDSTLPLH